MPFRITISVVGGGIDITKYIAIESDYSQHTQICWSAWPAAAYRTLQLVGSYGAKRFPFAAFMQRTLQLYLQRAHQRVRFVFLFKVGISLRFVVFSSVL